ncbi:MAG: phosphoglycerate mutase [Panacagrimonas sp.]|jgi:broad specificity phosphatase PhoE|nr:histidine phosphatase family protein [Panacagrimonas sp.]MCC2658389.1 phosphoglycerate mutase [Panacagrimonas sp.]
MDRTTDLVQMWPNRLWLVRHGQSAGNVARDLAESGRLPLIDIDTRDADTPLSDVGREQSAALGRWFARQRSERRPEFILVSPYVRAQQTAKAIADALGLPAKAPTMLIDERLREKEFGILDRYTVHGIRSKYPELDELRRRVGKFYFRPPGGESWCDVILRLRGMSELITREYVGRRVLVVAHQVIVSCFRYLLEHLDEAGVLAIDRAADVPNCSVTTFSHDATLGPRGGMRLESANVVTPVERSEVPVTAEPDAPQGPR